jgi:hypothetical protein
MACCIPVPWSDAGFAPGRKDLATFGVIHCFGLFAQLPVFQARALNRGFNDGFFTGFRRLPHRCGLLQHLRRPVLPRLGSQARIVLFFFAD